MADLTAFSNQAFSATTWINAAMKDAPEDESLEAYISSLSTKLHIMSQDYTDQLETAMVESMSTMPRILAEITRTEEQLRGIDAEMKSLSQQLNSFDQRNVAGVEDLSRLDALKTNMEKCKATLQEHARWSQLVREAKAIMEGGGKLSDSADRIETMYRSLAILKNLPGNLEREETCETFKNSLLSALRPIVRRDVAGVDIAPLQEYLYVFRKLGRETELQEEYVRARPDRIKALWDEYSIAKHTDFPKWLAAFLGKIARLLTEEEDSTSKLFGIENSPSVLCDLLIEALRPLSGGALAKRLALLKSPEVCFDAYSVMEEFSRRMMPHLLRVDELKQSLALAAMFAGFTEFQPAYADAEVNYLRTQFVAMLDSIVFSTREADPSTLQTPSKGKKAMSASLDDELFGSDGGAVDAYGLYGERILAVADQFQVPIQRSLQRTARFVGGTSSKQIVRAVSATLSLFIKHLLLKVDDLSVASGFPRDSSQIIQGGGLYGDLQSDGTTGGGGSGASAGVEKLKQQQSVADRFSEQLELSDVDSRVLITSALRTLQAIGRASKNFHELEKLVRGLMSDLQQTLFGGQGPSASLTVTLQQANGTPGTLTVGSAYALRTLQADLNSMSELRSFLAASTSNVSGQATFTAVSAVLNRLRGFASQLLFKLFVEAPEKMIGAYAQEDVWNLPCETGSTLELLRENMLPQSVVTQVGEHMLSLVQELEAFASSDALPDLLRLKGEARVLPIHSAGWQALKIALEIPDDDTLGGLCTKTKCSPLIGTIETTLLGPEAAALALAERAQLGEDDENDAEEGGGNGNGTGDSAGANGGEDEVNSAAVLTFVNEWLRSVADAAVGLLLSQIVLIPELSVAGSAQLLTDLEYLSNVINATGIRPHPLLNHVRLILQKNPVDLLKSIDLLPGKPKGAVGFLLKFDHILIAAIVKGSKI